ncbi:unnamed protein product [Durusdinium trenchii]|uniref:Uncharacterized protein n=1 Tax=Durusdinium trenchii TaxID=1381693 RepID=A0ABP0NM80_9DINO
MWALLLWVTSVAGECTGQCQSIVAGVCPQTPSPSSCAAVWEAFLEIMAQNTQALPPNAEGSKNQARFLRWRHLAHRGQMLSKSMLRPECWRSVPDPESMELGSERPCLSSQCLLDSSCHKRHVISELLTLAKQIDRSVALQVYEATKELFAWQRFEQTPMLFYPSFKAQVWFGEEDYPELLGAVRKHFMEIKEEFLRSYHLRSGRLTPAEEEYSGRQGWWCWEVWSALEGWVKERCEQMPTLCRVLRQHLPASKSSTLAAYLQEEVALFGLPPGEKFFAPHNDGSNARVALLMPLTHGRYSALEVNGERRAFGGDGHVLGFDASMDHFATYEAPPGVWDERWVLSIAVSHPQFDRHLAEGRLQTPRPDVQITADPHRWRRAKEAPNVAGWLELLDGAKNVVLLGSHAMLAASAPLVVRSGASTVVLGCEECDELGRTLHQKLSALPEVDRLVLVERQRLWEALEVQSIDVLVVDEDRVDDLLFLEGKHWRFTGPALAGLMKAWRSSSSRVVGIHLPAPSLPAGYTLTFGEGFWWFQQTKVPSSTASADLATSPSPVLAPFGATARVAAGAVERGLEDTPAVLLGLMARYASSNAQLALRCDPGDRERRAETARLVTSRLDVAQQALRSRQPDGELLIQAAARELVQTIAKVHMPHSCSVPLRVVPVKGRHEGSVPLIGFGTHELRALECYSAVRSALEAGVRHIDTAENYGNAEDLARAMRDSEVPREEIFVATKLSSTGLDQASSYRALASELQRLGGAADLCYLHFPSEKNLPAWRALEQLQQEGRCRQLGLSNFGRAELQQIWEHGQVKPVALQIQFSIYEPPSNAFLRWLAALPGKGLTVVAASTLNPEATGALNPMEDPHVQQIAARHDKSSAQVLLRWLVQQKVAVLPRSRQKQHIQENCDLDFVLTDHEMTHLSGLATLAQDLGAAEDSVRPEGAVDVFGLRGMS